MASLSRAPEAATLGPVVDVLRGRRITVLTGAGCSTESGIPDYRGPDGALRARKPMQYGEFVRSGAARARYWARSAVGWRRIAMAQPNAGHESLARLEAADVVRGVITQNVDGLHQAAGSRRVVELHGSLARVRCLECGEAVSRAAYQRRLLAANPVWALATEGAAGDGGAAAAPDGDAELAAVPPDFRVPGCGRCGGVMKPDVVFFGETVPRPRVDAAWRLFEEGDALLVVGSSLTVYSGRRFTDRARRERVPIAVVNLGRTRVDDAAAAKVEGHLGEVLPRLAAALLV